MRLSVPPFIYLSACNNSKAAARILLKLVDTQFSLKPSNKSTLHEELHALLLAEGTGWGVPEWEILVSHSQTRGGSSMMTSWPGRQAPDVTACTIKSFTRGNSDVTDTIPKGQGSNCWERSLLELLVPTSISLISVSCTRKCVGTVLPKLLSFTGQISYNVL
jgi:hypothetical protein